jgi:hypothetical protein
MMMNAADLPRYVVSKKLAGDAIAYYWNPHASVLRVVNGRPCPLKRQPLKSSYAGAIGKGNELNRQLDHWLRHGRLPDDAIPAEQIALEPGTFDYMIATYKAANPLKAKSYVKLDPKTRRHVDYLTKRVSDYILKDGTRVGDRMCVDFDPPFVDALYDKLAAIPDEKIEEAPEGIKDIARDQISFVQPGAHYRLPDGTCWRRSGPRRRTTNEAMAYCRRAWNVAHRATPELVPKDNPFAKMDLDHTSKETVPATYDDLLAFEAKAIEMNMPVLAFTARAAWDWLQRIEEICMSFAWSHYRPKDAPDHVFIGHEKNNSKVWKRVGEWVREEDAMIWVPFYPALEEHLARIKQLTPLVCSYEHRRGPKATTKEPKPAVNKQYSLRLLYRKAEEIRLAAGLQPHVTLGAFRHGGMTELGDMELPDTLALVQSRHKKRETLSRYIHRTEKQDVAGARIRVAYRREQEAARHSEGPAKPMNLHKGGIS